VRTQTYSIAPKRVKPTADEPADRVLLRLSPTGESVVMFLTTPGPNSKARLRNFCRAVVETPSFPHLGEAGR
jgi:hypothetical protein